MLKNICNKFLFVTDRTSLIVRIEQLATIIISGIAAWFLVHTLYSSYSAFTAYHFTSADFCKYTNMIWNCGHGEPFKVLVDYSYLETHLSFTLALLGPIFLIWDNPFTLSVVQWLFVIGGILFIWKIGRRDHLPRIVTATCILFFVANPYTQAVLLCEFHGVAIYFLLLPWLYYCLRFRKSFVWVPIILICGVREEAAFMLIPILLFFAIRDRWKTGYLWTVFAGIYGIFACTVLFEWINQASLSERRSGVSSTRIWNQLCKNPISQRLIPMFRITIPALAVLPYGWIAILVFPLIPVLQTFFSPYPVQYTYSFHYSAATQACLTIAVVHGMVTTWNKAPQKRRKRIIVWQATVLILVTIVYHILFGYLTGGGHYSKIYGAPKLYGQATLKAMQHIPRKGMLLCHKRLAAMCANRENIITWRLFDPEKHKPDTIFLKVNELRGGAARELEVYMTNSTFGITLFDGENIILERDKNGIDPQIILQVRDEWRQTINLAFTLGRKGKNILSDDYYITRYWHGSSKKKPTLVYGKAIKLDPGTYEADFYMHTGSDNTAHPGTLSVHSLWHEEALASKKIDITTTGKSGHQQLIFTINEPTQVEPKVIGGTVKLWLEKVVFRRQPVK
jgi:uncharacterized membrane protein